MGSKLFVPLLGLVLCTVVTAGPLHRPYRDNQVVLQDDDGSTPLPAARQLHGKFLHITGRVPSPYLAATPSIVLSVMQGYREQPHLAQLYCYWR